MPKYNCSFRGRQNGAIGVTSLFNIEVVAEDKDKAHLKIYDTHEHLSSVRIEEKGEDNA